MHDIFQFVIFKVYNILLLNEIYNKKLKDM